MSIVQSLHVPPDGWTVDEVPEIEGRWELVDGVLLVPPPEAPRNSRAEFRLGGLLAPALDDGWEVLIGGGLYFDQRNHRMPDLLVCRSTAVDAGRVRAADVLLACRRLRCFIGSERGDAVLATARGAPLRHARHPARRPASAARPAGDR